MDMEEYISDYKSEAQEHVSEAISAMLAAEKNPADTEQINTAFRALHTLKSMSAAMGFTKLSSLCHSLEDTLESVRQKKRGVDPQLVDGCLRALDIISSGIESCGKNGEAEIDIAEFEKSLALASKPQVVETHNAPYQNQDRKENKPENANEYTRIRMEKLDLLLNLAGELVINSSALDRLVKMHKAKEFRDFVNTSERVAGQMHEEILSARLVEAEEYFKNFPRAVRDIAKEKGKATSFTMSGTSLQLDRAILEKIAPAILHLLRNAVDHGIEDPQARLKAGKKNEGKITLTLSRYKSNALVTIEDDGEGIDSANIKKAAIEKKFITKEQGDGIGGDDAFQLLFLPGFSTSMKVSETSGRGVGLNAVKTTLMQLGGTIEVHSRKGKGTSFSLSFPLSVAVVNSLVVLCGKEKYALALSHILRSLPLNTLKIRHAKKDFVTINEEVPIMKLSTFLGLHEERSGKEKVVLLEAGSRKLALVVEEIAERQGILVKPIPTFLQKSRLFTGATVLASGEIALVLDVPAIFEKFELNS